MAATTKVKTPLIEDSLNEFQSRREIFEELRASGSITVDVTPDQAKANLLARRRNRRSRAAAKSGQQQRRLYCCDRCVLKFFDPDELIKHKKKHEIQLGDDGTIQGKRYGCKICRLPFCNATAARRHMETQHKTGPVHRCHVCDRDFLRVDRLSEHVQSNTHSRQIEKLLNEGANICGLLLDTRNCLTKGSKGYRIINAMLMDIDPNFQLDAADLAKLDSMINANNNVNEPKEIDSVLEADAQLNFPIPDAEGQQEGQNGVKMQPGEEEGEDLGETQNTTDVKDTSPQQQATTSTATEDANRRFSIVKSMSKKRKRPKTNYDDDPPYNPIDSKYDELLMDSNTLSPTYGNESNSLSTTPYGNESNNEDAFCRSVAAEMREMTPQERCLVKLQIQQIIYDVRFAGANSRTTNRRSLAKREPRDRYFDSDDYVIDE